MAELTNVFTTHTAIGNKEDLSDFITNISPEEAPAYDRLGSVNASAVLHEWQVDVLRAATSNAQTEGKQFSATAITPTVRINNRVQTFTEEFTVSTIQEKVSKAGRAKESAYQMDKAAKALKRDFEYTLWNLGADATGADGSAGLGRKMKDIHAWISGTNNTGCVSTLTADASATMTETEFNKSWQMIWAQGGKPNAVYCAGNLKRLISGWGTSTSRVWSGEKKITNTVGVYEGDYGILETVLDRYTNAKAVYLVQEDLFKKATLEPVQWRNLGVLGLGTSFMLYTTWTVESRNASGSGMFYSNA